MTGHDVAAAALSLVGTRFRLHGRQPGSALDCVGVIEAALIAAGWPGCLPNGYALRTSRAPSADAITSALGLPQAQDNVQPGDILVLVPAVCQLHFAVATSAITVVHAHAGLGKVVHGPLPSDWPRLGIWRPSSNAGT